MMTRHQTAVSAEAFAAGVFAQAGYSVFVQYGANQPGYDLVISDDDKGYAIRVNVKGSNNGGWILAAKDKNGSYDDALKQWHTQNSRFIFCLVQFSNVQPGEMPRMYLATGEEIEAELRHHWFGEEICLSLIENYSPKRGPHKGKVSCIPANWRMTEERIGAVFCQTAEHDVSSCFLGSSD